MEHAVPVIAHYSLVNALGRGTAASLAGLRENRSGLRNNDYVHAPLDTWIGRVDGIEMSPLPTALADFDCRNNRLAALCLEQDGFAEHVAALRRQLGAKRIGLFLGTSTSGIEETETAYRKRDSKGRLPSSYRYMETQIPFSLGDFVRHYLQLEGPSQVVSTACSSSAKVFATAYRHINAGLCDAAIVGGVDTLCATTLHGFNSLELIASDKCRPWDIDRGGINIGEAAGFAILQKARPGDATIALLGYGESSDAYHMSTPHPEGNGALMAMQQALAMAKLEPSAIDYINLHGTATPANDKAEDRAVSRMFDKAPPCSSTKGLTGHTLGAAGITEAIFAVLSIEHGLLPATCNTTQPDPALKTQPVLQPREHGVRHAMSNSFGFGGSNCSLVFGRLSS